MIMRLFSRHSSVACFALMTIMLGLLAIPVSAADAYYDGYLGDVVDLHGVSYTGTNVYLFMTGPNLPADGVTLTDTSLRADQGHFTIIPLNSDQQWSFKWDTQRLQTQIDPGTYTVYVTTDPVDYSHLGGTSTYKTLSVYLANTHAPQGESGPGTYTLNPEEHTSMVIPTLVMGTPNVTPNATTIPTSVSQPPTVQATTVTLAAPPSPSPTQAAVPVIIPLAALAGGLGLILKRH